MNLRDMDGNHKVQTVEELNALLLKRHRINNAEVNSFWLSYDGGFPCMCVMVNDGLATSWYSPKEGQAGYVSATTFDTLEKGGVTLFYLDNQKQEVANHLVVKWPEAVEAVRQFLRSSDLPHSIRWIEL